MEKNLSAQKNRNKKIIIQHNNLIEARYYFTLQEKRLMCWLASQIKTTDEDFKEHKLSVREFADLIEVKGDHLYKTLDDITTKLMRKIITIKEIDNQSFIKAALLGGAKYHAKKGYLKLSFHPYLKPYMLQLKERFTKIKLGDVLGLRSVYAMRIYEIIKQYEIFGSRKISLDDLRELCGINQKQYTKYNNLKKDVLERAKKEINAKTDLRINYTEVKESRKVIAIEWTIQKKRQPQKLVSTQKEYRSNSVLFESLIEYGFTQGIAKRILKNNEEEVITNALKAVNLQIERNHVKNPKAMLQAAIKEKWHPEVFQKKERVA